MSESKPSISKGRSYEEIGEYWDSHDASEAWDQGKPVEFEIDVKAGKRYFPIEKNLSQKLDQIARSQGVSAETLINLWLQEKIALAR
jgi:hypothetical protein